METKICTKCGEEKESSSFSKGKKQCKLCQKEYRANYYKLHKQEEKEDRNKYYKIHPEKLKAVNKNNYEKNKEERREYAIKYYNINADTIKETRKEKYKDNPEDEIEYSKEYREKYPYKVKESQQKYLKTPKGKFTASKKRHRRRALSKQTPCTLTLIQWEKILETQGNKCAICGKRFCKSRPPTKDHIVPLSKGGGLTFENVQALCHSCNSSKNASLDHTKIITWSHHGITT